MKINKKQKRLIGLDAIKKANELFGMGVPITKIHIMLELDKVWSYASTQNLLKPDFDGLHDSTRPPWLQDTPLVQSPPVSWAFTGTFPYGEWIETNR